MNQNITFLKITLGCRYLNVNLQGGDLDPEEGGHGIEVRSS